MINFKTYTYLLVFSILTFSCKASPQQDKKYPSLATDLHKYHLNGPVKMMRCYMDFKEDGLTKDQIKLNDAQGVVNITGSGKGYFKFNNNGMMVKYHGLPDSINQVLNDTIRIYKKGAGVENIYIYIYIYNENDIKNKAKIVQSYKPVKWVFNPYRLILNKDSYRTYDVMVKKDSSYKEVNHEYTYDFNSNRILKESSYSVFDHNLDGIPDKEVPNYFASYIYNNKDQLVSKTFDMSKTWWGEGVLMPDHNLQLEGGKETPIETYTYDAVGNLTSVYTYANAAKTVLVHTEDYFYNNNNQLVRLLRRKATGMMGAFNRHFKRLNEFFFNDKGDVIQINSYENDEKTIHATYFYEYSGYDKYYNWTHMEMRIKDVPTKEPTMVADRIIEYYEE